MPDRPVNPQPNRDAPDVAAELAARLEAADCDYAIGDAIALGFWAEPRGTLDVDVTLYLPLNDPHRCMNLLEQIGCNFDRRRTHETLQEHTFCQVEFSGLRLDVFLPMSPFYEAAKSRRRRVPLANGHAFVWDAETLCVFKMMFFRRKDLTDVEAILLAQGEALDRQWIETSLIDLYGQRDPRINQWRELLTESQGE